MEQNDMIIAFALSNGEKYFISHNGKVIHLDESITYEHLQATAKQYSYVSSKVVTTKLWNKQILKHLFNENLNIERSCNFSLQKVIEKYHKEKPYTILNW